MSKVKTLLSNANLDIELLAIIERMREKNAGHASILKMLYDTGMRVEEYASLNRWTLQRDGMYCLTTAKDSMPRIFNPNELSNEFIEMVTYDRIMAPWYSPYQIMKSFYTFSSFQLYFIGNKPATFHLYRHNKIKRLFDDGFSIHAISSIMGIKSIEVVSGYVNSEVYGQFMK